MSISSEISRISGNVSDSLGAVSDMGGTVPNNATSDDLETAIRSIPQVELPIVDSSDNGKVLKVSNGSWSAMDNTVVLTTSISLESVESVYQSLSPGFGVDAPGLTLTSGTYSAAVTAIQNKQHAILRVDVKRNNTTQYYVDLPLEIVGSSSLKNKPFSIAYSDLFLQFTIRRNTNTPDQDGDITYSRLRCLPNVSSSDNGKVLTVSNGEWTKQNLPEPERKANIRKITDYLYYFDVDFDLDYAAAEQYVIDNTETSCSVVRNGNYVGRNFDNLYNNIAEFVVSTKALKGRHASIGVATMLTDITNTEADSGEWDDLYEILPFCIMDGINDKGVFVEMNTVDNNNEFVTEIDNDADLSVSTVMLGRYILDYANSAAHAIQLLGEINIIPPMTEHAQELHYMIADPNTTYEVEFVSDGNGGVEMVAIQLPDGNDHLPVATNFYLRDYFVDDETIVGYGENRYEYAVEHYNSCGTKQGMIDMMNGLHHTEWYNVTLGERNGTQVHTRHSSIYDFQNRALTVFPQPDVIVPTGEYYNFAVNGDAASGAVTSWDDLQDKPFYYESKTDYNYATDLELDYISGTVKRNDLVLPTKFYHVGKALTSSQLVGGVATLVGNGTVSEKTIASADIEEIEVNGDTVGLLVSDSTIPYAIVIYNNNTTLDYDGTNFTITGTFGSRGVYAPWIDLSAIQSGATAYIASLVGATKESLKKLDEKFYNGTYWVDADFELSTMQIARIEQSSADILAACSENRPVNIKIQVLMQDVATGFEVTGKMYGKNGDACYFSAEFIGNFDGTDRLYFLNVAYSGSTITSQMHIVNTTSMS